MGTEMKTNFSDDEEDLESLRLAALSSLKKKNEANGLTQQNFTNEKNYNYNKGNFRGGKRRFFQGQSGRNGRNGQYNNPVRNSNLISIPTVADEKDQPQPIQKSSKFVKKDDDVPKLIRPQDRYSVTTGKEVESEGPISKFDRYDNSDNSESEEEDEISSAKLERSDSLEALIEELDAEILGESKREKKEKVKLKKESKIVVEERKENVQGNSDNTEVNPSEYSDKQPESNNEVIVHTSTKVSENTENSLCINTNKSENTNHEEVKLENPKPLLAVNKHQNQRSPSQLKIQNRRINGRVFNPEPPFIPSSNNPILIPNAPFMNPLQTPQFTTVYNTVPPFTGPDVFPINVPPPSYIPPPGLPPHMMPLDGPPAGFNVLPLQPLVIDHPAPHSSIPMGPLSPRSAAFVLQNRAIVEKRKRSPRSYSRSPSPPTHRFRYSKSPSRRSLSPLRRSRTPIRRSMSPSRRPLSPRRSPIRRSLSPYRRHREKSPRRDSPRRSPRRMRESPRRSPKRSKESPKRLRETRRTPIKDRLGTRNKNEEKDIKKKEDVVSSPKKQDFKSLDPVLEARKRKFESKEMKVKEGVIRLKPKEETVQNVKDEDNSSTSKNEEKIEVSEINEDLVQRVNKEIVVKPSSKEETSTRIVLLPKMEEKCVSEEPQVDQLEEAMNELEMLLKDEEALELNAKVDDLFTDEETDQENEGRFKVKKGSGKEEKPTLEPFRKLVNGKAKNITEKKIETKAKWNFEEAKTKSKKSKKEPLTNPIENRKIEIKIRNPAKYERNGSKIQSSVSTRKVELAKKGDLSEDESEPEIVVENEDEEDNFDEVAAGREGDLRAQLSRKRAERQNKLPSIEGVQSRLLQSALEGAVFKKKKSKKRDKESKDMKLPIHLRLGIAHDSDIFAEAAMEKISRKKSKKRKHATVEQV